MNHVLLPEKKESTLTTKKKVRNQDLHIAIVVRKKKFQDFRYFFSFISSYLRLPMRNPLPLLETRFSRTSPPQSQNALSPLPANT